MPIGKRYVSQLRKWPINLNNSYDQGSGRLDVMAYLVRIMAF